MIQINTLTKTCISCPSQWEGELSDGRQIYIRFRHGCLSAGIGQNIIDAVDNSLKDTTGPDSFYDDIEADRCDRDGTGGMMSSADMLSFIVPWLETL